MADESIIKALEERIEELEQKIEESNSNVEKKQKGLEKDSKGISRREFLKKAGIGSVSLGALLSPVSADYFIKDDSFSVQTSNDGGSTLSEGLFVDQNQNVNIPNGTLDLNNNNIAQVGRLNGADIQNAASGTVPTAQGDGTLTMQEASGGEGTAAALVGFSIFPAETEQAVREDIYQNNFDPLARSGRVLNIFTTPTIKSEVVTYQNAMEKTATYQASMEQIAGSSTAMDVVASSNTARNFIGTSGSDSTGYTVISNSNMAIGKYVAAYAGLTPSNYADMSAITSDNTAMNSVSSSDTAMDVVASSNTAMNAISESPTALSILLRSNSVEDTVWDSSAGAAQVFANAFRADNGNRVSSFPATITGQGVAGDTSSGWSDDLAIENVNGKQSLKIYYENTGDPDNNNAISLVEVLVDLTNVTALEVSHIAPSDYGQRVKVAIYPEAGSRDNADLIINPGYAGSSWSSTSADVSSYSGNHYVTFGHFEDPEGENWIAYSDLRLE